MWICFSILTGFFAVNRGPNKRQIKPAGNNSLLQLALGEDSEDSEEDADFELNDDDDDEGATHMKSTLLIDWLSWLIDWLVDWSIDPLIDWLINNRLVAHTLE